MLKDLVVQTLGVPYGNQNIVVSGLSFADVTMLLTQHEEALKKAFDVFDRVAGEGNTLADINVEMVAAEIGMELMKDVPAFVNVLIATACGEPDQADKVGKLPVPVQLDLLNAVGVLTLVDAAGARQFMGKILRLLQEMKKQAKLLKSGLTGTKD